MTASQLRDDLPQLVWEKGGRSGCDPCAPFRWIKHSRNVSKMESIPRRRTVSVVVAVRKIHQASPPRGLSSMGGDRQCSTALNPHLQGCRSATLDTMWWVCGKFKYNCGPLKKHISVEQSKSFASGSSTNLEARGNVETLSGLRPSCGYQSQTAFQRAARVHMTRMVEQLPVSSKM